ncbi:MAG TPA: class I SAM-dependent methyltransferase [Solirubrobacteraceae bacterium]|nr:class I SAM-dependent methyltransferase [Solirubrobacteraceae bacterium]
MDVSRAQARAEADAALEEVIWHDLECGGYDADLELWRRLADEHAVPRESAAILEIGAGTGRVAIDLASRGHNVTAVEIRPELLCALIERAGGLAVEAVCADARTLSLSRRDYALCLVPMQTLQLFGGARERGAFLACARAHLRTGGLLCCALVTEPEAFDSAQGDAVLSAERARIGGREYVSRPTRVLLEPATITIERERRILPASAGSALEAVALDRLGASALRSEGRAAGLHPAGAVAIPATADHVGATVVVLRA